MSNKFKYVFTVSGMTSTFPLDMLRYDSCEAASIVDFEKLCKSLPREEYLPVKDREKVVFDMTSTYPPTVDRWSSFGWTCTEGRKVLI